MSKNTNMVLQCIERAKKKQQEMDATRAKYTTLRNRYYQQSRRLGLKLEDEFEQLSKFTSQTATTVKFGDLIDSINKFKGEEYSAVGFEITCNTKTNPFYQFNLKDAKDFEFNCTINMHKNENVEKFTFKCDVNDNIVQLNRPRMWSYLESDKAFNSVLDQEKSYYSIPDRFLRGITVDVPVALVVSSPIMEQAVLHLMEKQKNKGC